MKHLVRSFGLNSIENEVLKHNWVLPSMEQVREADIDYEVVWVNDLPEKESDHNTHGCLYNTRTDRLEVCNKNHKHNVVVLKGSNG